MTVSRRKFLQSSVTSGAALMLPDMNHPGEKVIQLPAGFALQIMATNWGYDGTVEQFCAKVKQAGYDGIEVGWPTDTGDQQKILAAARSQGLSVGFLIGVWDTDDYEAHRKSFEKKLQEAAATQPLYINCHAGKDHFSYDQNVAFINFTARVGAETKVPIYHETHRGRILYAAPIAKNYLEKIPGLRVTLDISHWCAVHESLLGDQAATVNLALERTDHIHARVGHAEGPQVNDPRAPEWTKAVDTHLAWWDQVVNNKIKSGAQRLTFLTEFGPPDYLPTLPYTRQPVANQWEINVHMMQMLRKRYLKG